MSYHSSDSQRMKDSRKRKSFPDDSSDLQEREDHSKKSKYSNDSPEFHHSKVSWNSKRSSAASSNFQDRKSSPYDSSDFQEREDHSKFSGKRKRSPSASSDFQDREGQSKRKRSSGASSDFQYREGQSKRNHQRSSYDSFSPSNSHRRGKISFDEEIQHLFEKKFAFKKPSDEVWTIDVLTNPERNEQDASEIGSKSKESYDTLSELKSELNEIKDGLSNQDITTWHEHTRFMHTAGAVIGELRNAFKVELCTQAFCKFYEMVCQYDLVPKDQTDFHSVHLCEAPGAFITALNHYLRSHDLYPDWDWIASTLSPYYEGNSHNQMIDDDRFIRGSLDKWYFGEDGTGNLMCEKNISSLEKKSSHLTNILLVTADGSIDCQDAPSDQESLVSRLHYYETLTALRLLKKGGSFVLKVFTMFETESIILMYILNCCFTKVNVIKPGTSKPGNSEVYIVSQDFTGEAEDAINFIQNHLNGTKEEESKVISFPASFLNEHAKCCRKFVGYQCNAINNNLATYDREQKATNKGNYREQKEKREYCKDYFVNIFNVRRINRDEKIVWNEGNWNRSAFKLGRRFEPITYGSFSGNHYQGCTSSSDKKLTGSFNERKKRSNLPWNERVKEMETFDVPKNLAKMTCTEHLSDDDVRYWRRISEVSIDQVQSSRFVDSKTLDCLNEIKAKAQILPSLTEKKYEEILKLCGRRQLYCWKCDEGLLNKLKRIEKQVVKVVEEDENLSNDVNIKMLVCQIVRSDQSEVDEEVKQKFLSAVRFICKNLQQRDNAVLHISTCLTRFSAGLVYILARCFTTTSITPIPSVNLEQLLLLEDFTEKPDSLDEYLHEAVSELNNLHQDNMTLGEILPLDTMISDREFTKFLKETNQNTLVKFINSTITSEKKRIHEEKK